MIEKLINMFFKKEEVKKGAIKKVPSAGLFVKTSVSEELFILEEKIAKINHKNDNLDKYFVNVKGLNKTTCTLLR